MLKNDSKLSEKILCEIWKNKVLQKEFRTFNDESISVINIGTENEELAGPDFLNAKVRIGNLVYVGDVEIDIDYADWKSHGHYLDKRYNKVIVHASLINRNQSSYVYSKEGRKIPSVCLAEYFKDDLSNISINELNANSNHSSQYLRCKDVNNTLEQNIKKDFLRKLGLERFDKKKDKILYRLKELTYLRELNLKEPVVKYEINPDFLNREFTPNDFKIKEIWQQLFYEFIFEALGYSKNKNAMLNLAKSANVNFIKSVSDSNDLDLLLHSSLYNIAGFLIELGEDENEDYLNSIKSLWNSIKEKYDGRLLNKSNWHFFKLRPNNFPTIRIAGGAALLRKIIFEELIENLISRFDRINNPGVLTKAVKTLFVVPANGYWKYHYTFEDKKKIELKYFIGGSRADEIIINVVLPFIFVYGEVLNFSRLRKKVRDIYSQYTQNEDNSIAKFMAESLFINNAWKKSILSQGMLELFRFYCSKNKCLDCPIGKLVFN